MPRATTRPPQYLDFPPDPTGSCTPPTSTERYCAIRWSTTWPTWLGNYVAQFESALSGAGFANPAIGYSQYIDVLSWIDYHIMTELTYNVDEWYLSTYLSKDRGGKLKLGPFWDFDRSLGNTTQIGGAGTTGWYSDALTAFFAGYWGLPAAQVVEYPWFRRLFQDSNFSQQYVDRYQEL